MVAAPTKENPPRTINRKHDPTGPTLTSRARKLGKFGIVLRPEAVEIAANLLGPPLCCVGEKRKIGIEFFRLVL